MIVAIGDLWFNGSMRLMKIGSLLLVISGDLGLQREQQYSLKQGRKEVQR
ncbi:hypothetical protein [Ktedonosporobacter rubrisoli]